MVTSGCGGGSGSLPVFPPGSPAPPKTLAHGSIAVLIVARGIGSCRILIFPPQSDKVARDFSLPACPTSIVFARHNRLFYGIDGGHDEFFVRELDVASGERVRSIDIKQSSSFASSLATDDYNVLYVNTKSSVGGDVKLFQPEHVKPYLEIKDALRPVTIHIAHDSLWVGFYGLTSDALARYDVRSTKRTWFSHTGNNLPSAIAVNPDGSLLAARVLRNNQRAVIVYDTKKDRSKKIHEGDTQALASDNSGNLYVAQKSGRILICTFNECAHSFETNLEIHSLAWNPRDGMLYVSARGSRGNGVFVYNPRTTTLIREIPVEGNQLPGMISIEA